MRKLFFLLVVIIIQIIWNYSIYPQNFNDALRLTQQGLGSNARALGMGNAYNAISNDFSATAFNPAGLGLVHNFEFSAGLNYNSFSNNTRFFNNSVETSNSSTNLNQLGFVFPFPTERGSLVFALGYSKIKDFNSALKFDGFNIGDNSMIQDLTFFNDDIAYELGVSYPLFNSQNEYIKDTTVINGMLNQSGEIIKEGSINKWTLAGAVEVAQNVFVGVNLNIISGNYNSDREYYEDDLNNVYDNTILTDPDDNRTSDFQTFFFNDIIDWDIAGWDMMVGILYKINKFVHVGTTIKFPTEYTIKEEYFVDGSSQFGNNQSFYLEPPILNEVEYDISTPFEFTGSAAMKVASLTVSGDIKFIDYTQMEFDSGLEPDQISQNNKDIRDLFRGILNYNIGAEYEIPFAGVKIRGGFIYQPSPYKEDPSEYNKKYFTAGLGFDNNNAFALDVGYAYGWWKTIGDNYGLNVSRTFQDINVHNLLLTVTYRY